MDVNSQLTDPQFVDVQLFDFSLAPSSPALVLGFKQIGIPCLLSFIFSSFVLSRLLCVDVKNLFLCSLVLRFVFVLFIPMFVVFHHRDLLFG